MSDKKKRVTQSVHEKMRMLCEDICKGPLRSIGASELEGEVYKYETEYDLSFTHLESDKSVYVAFRRKSGNPVIEMSRCLNKEYDEIFTVVSRIFGGYCFLDNSGKFLSVTPKVEGIEVSNATVVLEGNMLSIFSADGSYYVGHSADRYVECYMRPAKPEDFRKVFDISGSNMLKVTIERVVGSRNLNRVESLVLNSCNN